MQIATQPYYHPYYHPYPVTATARCDIAHKKNHQHKTVQAALLSEALGKDKPRRSKAATQRSAHSQAQPRESQQGILVVFRNTG